ncbi:unnamed protein product [Brachionus calyciflorus]|uniref:Uncharacterized protein n=1 Tax=Brachionus calyciflorus TaxID=104777 RepID=A0A813MYM9_9BILA|nr:unnamed protein product [Brachionus calyciflorus]
MKILILSIIILISSIDANKLIQSKFWLTSCSFSGCYITFNSCLNCFGERNCKNCITSIKPECSVCADDIYNKNDLEEIGGNQYFICDSLDNFQVKACQLYCRGQYFQSGQCLRVQNVPVCQCSLNDQPLTSTLATSISQTTPLITTPSTTTTATIPTTTTRSSTTITFSNNYPGLVNNYSISLLTYNGFRIVYEALYSHRLNSSDLTGLRNQCNLNSVICVGGSKVGSSILHLAACANCLSVLTETPLNSPRKVGSAFWHFTPKESFGFAPNSEINQNNADFSNHYDNSRLSWHIDRNGGGWRLGSIIYLNNDTSHKRYIFIRP